MSIFSARKKNRPESRTLSKVDFKDKDSVIAFVEGRYQHRANHRQGMERQWFLNIAFYLNLHYHHFDGVSQTLVKKEQRKGRVRLTCNKITPATQKFVSKFMRQKPVWTALPATNDHADRVKAILGTRLLRYYHRVLNMDRKLVDFATWLRTTGNCFMRFTWDPEKSHEIMFAPEELAGLDPSMQKIAEQGLNLGDIDVRVRPPFAIDVDPAATDMSDAAWLLDSSAVPIDKLAARYGNDVKKLAPDTKSDESLNNYYQKKIQDLAGSGGISGFGTDEEDDDTIMVHELWVAPMSRTRGYHCVVAGGRVLQIQDRLPSDLRVIPYGHVADIPVPGRFWGVSAIEYAIPLQSSYNKGRSQMIQHRNLCMKPKVLEPFNSGILESSFTDEPGERVKFRWPLKPEYMQIPDLPETTHRILDYDKADMEDNLGIHDVSYGRPGNVRHGVAIAALQEQDDQTHAPVFARCEKMLSDGGSIILQLCSRNITEERGVRIVGDEHEIDFFTFKGEDLYGPNKDLPGVNYFDVECQMGSQLPQSKAQKTQFVIDLVNAHIFDPVQDSKKIKQMLELGSEEPGIKSDQLDRQNARRENMLMAQGIFPEPQPQDNPEIHMEELLIWMKSSEFYELIQQNPQVNEMAQAHLQMTQQQMAPPPMVGGMPGEGPMPDVGTPGVEAEPEELAMMLAQGG